MYKVCQEQTKKLHPDFEYRFYTDADMDAFIKTDFREYYEQFNRLPRMIMKIDMFRYFLMYKCGGLYMDMDYYMIKPFDLLHHRVVLPCNREFADGTPSCLGNCIFASAAGHPFWKWLIDSLLTDDRSDIDFTSDSNVDGHEHGTGPMFVFGMWKRYVAEHGTDGIHVCQRKLFHPPRGNGMKDVNKLRAQGCYGVHLCTGMWRNMKL